MNLIKIIGTMFIVIALTACGGSGDESIGLGEGGGGGGTGVGGNSPEDNVWSVEYLNQKSHFSIVAPSNYSINSSDKKTEVADEENIPFVDILIHDKINDKVIHTMDDLKLALEAIHPNQTLNKQFIWKQAEGYAFEKDMSDHTEFQYFMVFDPSSVIQVIYRRSKIRAKQLKNDPIFASLKIDFYAPEIRSVHFIPEVIKPGEELSILVDVYDRDQSEISIYRKLDYSQTFDGADVYGNWLGYNFQHRMFPHQSLMYKFPLERFSNIASNLYLSQMQIPTWAPTGEMNLMGLTIKDAYGRSTIISLQDSQNEETEQQFNEDWKDPLGDYRLISGRKSNMLTTQSVKIESDFPYYEEVANETTLNNLRLDTNFIDYPPQGRLYQALNFKVSDNKKFYNWRINTQIRRAKELDYDDYDDYATAFLRQKNASKRIIDGKIPPILIANSSVIGDTFEDWNCIFVKDLQFNPAGQIDLTRLDLEIQEGCWTDRLYNNRMFQIRVKSVEVLSGPDADSAEWQSIPLESETDILFDIVDC